MAYPNVLYAPEGEQYNIYAIDAHRYPYGTQMVMQDGRKYRYFSNGVASVGVVGTVYQGAIGVANDIGRTAIAAALGSRAPTLTTGGAVTANFYAEGYWCNDVTPAEGLYVIDNHLAGTTATVFNFAAGHAVRGAAITTATRVSLIQNPYKNVIVCAAPQTAAVVGVMVSAPVASGGQGWIQTAGMAVVLASGTLVVGNAAVTSIGAGALGPAGAASTLIAQQTAGYATRIGGTWAEVKLSGIDA